MRLFNPGAGYEPDPLTSKKIINIRVLVNCLCLKLFEGGDPGNFNITFPLVLNSRYTVFKLLFQQFSSLLLMSIAYEAK
jgi:hypothetical protein